MVKKTEKKKAKCEKKRKKAHNSYCDEGTAAALVALDDFDDLEDFAEPATEEEDEEEEEEEAGGLVREAIYGDKSKYCSTGNVTCGGFVSKTVRGYAFVSIEVAWGL